MSRRRPRLVGTHALVDVSESARPRMIATSGATNGAPAKAVEAATDLLTIFAVSDAATSASSQPKEIRTLPAVTTFFKDQAHGIIYAANGEGLWVVKTKQAADLDTPTLTITAAEDRPPLGGFETRVSTQHLEPRPFLLSAPPIGATNSIFEFRLSPVEFNHAPPHRRSSAALRRPQKAHRTRPELSLTQRKRASNSPRSKQE